MDGLIDLHTHYVPCGWPELPGIPELTLWLRVESESDAVIMLGTREFRRIQATCWNADVRLRDMDKDGVAIQAVSPTPAFFSYAHAGDEATRIARIFNDLALEICAPQPDRLWPFCQVPLQDTDAACAEVEAALLAVIAASRSATMSATGISMTPVLSPSFNTARRLGVPVFVHPWDMPESPRLNRWMARWLTGMPAETHLSILAMILGGVFDQVDESLRICFAHGGGSFAFWLGRMDNAWRARNDVIGTSAEPPSRYIGRFYVDSVVFDERALRLLVDTVGVDRVVVGSDYPYPLGERPAGKVVRESLFLDEPERHQILRDNAEVFLGASVVQS